LAVYGGIALILYDLMTKIEKNKSEYEENWSSTFATAPSVVYKTSIFPTVIFFVSEKNRAFSKMSVFRDFSKK
jgi:CRISPR/Cas system CMR-associated protein Cmr5 small subunit